MQQQRIVTEVTFFFKSIYLFLCIFVYKLNPEEFTSAIPRVLPIFILIKPFLIASFI